jgi:hypothetical protein
MSSHEIERFESIGELSVRRLLAEGQLGSPGSRMREEVETWLAFKELERNLSNSASAESIAREQLKIARAQRKIAIAAIVLSAITAIIAAFIGGILSYSSSSPLKFPESSSSASSQSGVS